MKNFHLPLPIDLYEELKQQSNYLKKPATALAREALTLWLKEQKKAQIAQEITAYAQEFAGSEDDLIPELEAASIELLNDTP